MEHRNLYQEWIDALKRPTFDPEQLAEIHTLYQARQRAEADYKARWAIAEAAHRAEVAEAERAVRAELAGKTKAQLRARFEERAGWAPEPNDRLWTRERFLDDEIRRATDKIPSTYDRMKA